MTANKQCTLRRTTVAVLSTLLATLLPSPAAASTALTGSAASTLASHATMATQTAAAPDLSSSNNAKGNSRSLRRRRLNTLPAYNAAIADAGAAVSTRSSSIVDGSLGDDNYRDDASAAVTAAGSQADGVFISHERVVQQLLPGTRHRLITAQIFSQNHLAPAIVRISFRHFFGNLRLVGWWFETLH